TTFRRGDGAVAGEHKVVIVAMDDTSAKLPEQRSGTPPALVPDKYTSIATTDLRGTVREGDNTIDFTLGEGERPGRPPQGRRTAAGAPPRARSFHPACPLFPLAAVSHPSASSWSA